MELSSSTRALVSISQSRCRPEGVQLPNQSLFRGILQCLTKVDVSVFRPTVFCHCSRLIHAGQKTKQTGMSLLKATSPAIKKVKVFRCSRNIFVPSTR